MATIEIKDSALLVTVEGFDKILALRKGWTTVFPLSHITGVPRASSDISKQMMYYAGGGALVLRGAHPGQHARRRRS